MSKFPNQGEFEVVWSAIRAGTGTTHYESLMNKAHQEIVRSIQAEKDHLSERCTKFQQQLDEISRLLGRQYTLQASHYLEPRAAVLEATLAEAQTELEDRQAALDELLSNCNQLAASLGLEPVEAPATFSAEDIEPLIVQQRRLEKLVRERTQFYRKMLEPVFALYAQLRVTGEFAELEDPKVLQSRLQPSTETAIQEEHKRLLKLCRDMQREVEELTGEIRRINEVLDHPVQVAEDATPSNIESLRSTLGELRALFMEHIGTLYANARVSHLEKAAALGFSPDPEEPPTEESYQRLIAANAALQQVLTNRAKLDSLAEELLGFEAVEADLLEASKNPERLKARGTVLQQECRLRQRVAVRKPKVIKLLREKLPQWLAEYGSFVYKGRDFAPELEEGGVLAGPAVGRVRATTAASARREATTRAKTARSQPSQGGQDSQPQASLAQPLQTQRPARAPARAPPALAPSLSARTKAPIAPSRQPITTPTPAPGRMRATPLPTLASSRRPFGPVNGGVRKQAMRAPKPNVPVQAPVQTKATRVPARVPTRAAAPAALTGVPSPTVATPSPIRMPRSNARQALLVAREGAQPLAQSPLAESTPLRKSPMRTTATTSPLREAPRTPERNPWDISFDPNFSGVSSNTPYIEWRKQTYLEAQAQARRQVQGRM